MKVIRYSTSVGIFDRTFFNFYMDYYYKKT